MKVIKKTSEFEADDIYFMLVQKVDEPLKVEWSKIYYYEQNNTDLDMSEIIDSTQHAFKGNSEYRILSFGEKDPEGIQLLNRDIDFKNVGTLLNYIHNLSRHVLSDSQEARFKPDTAEDRGYFYNSTDSIFEKNEKVFDYFYDITKTSFKEMDITVSDKEAEIIIALELLNQHPSIDSLDAVKLKTFYTNMVLPVIFEEKGIEPESTFVSQKSDDERKYFRIKEPDMFYLTQKPYVHRRPKI